MNKDNIGHCYELNYKYLLNHPNYILVHGYITNIFPPYQTIDHAWCTKDDIIYDAVQEKEYPWEIYKSLMKAEIAKKYTIKQALEMTFKFQTYGCWHEVRDLNLEKYYDDNKHLKDEYKNFK